MVSLRAFSTFTTVRPPSGLSTNPHALGIPALYRDPHHFTIALNVPPTRTPRSNIYFEPLYRPFIPCCVWTYHGLYPGAHIAVQIQICLGVWLKFDVSFFQSLVQMSDGHLIDNQFTLVAWRVSSGIRHPYGWRFAPRRTLVVPYLFYTPPAGLGFAILLEVSCALCTVEASKMYLPKSIHATAQRHLVWIREFMYRDLRVVFSRQRITVYDVGIGDCVRPVEDVQCLG